MNTPRGNVVLILRDEHNRDCDPEDWLAPSLEAGKEMARDLLRQRSHVHHVVILEGTGVPGQARVHYVFREDGQ